MSISLNNLNPTDMDREYLKGKQTPGEVSLCNDNEYRSILVGLPITVVSGINGLNGEQANANMVLYAEAHSVANRIGLWPEDIIKRAGAFIFKPGDKVINIQAHGWGEGIIEFVSDHETVSVLWNNTRHALHSPDQLAIIANYQSE